MTIFARTWDPDANELAALQEGLAKAETAWAEHDAMGDTAMAEGWAAVVARYQRDIADFRVYMERE